VAPPRSNNYNGSAPRPSQRPQGQRPRNER
jgi:hypothetical protein